MGHPFLRVFDWYVLKPLWFIYIVLVLLYFFQGFWTIGIFLSGMLLLVSIAGSALYGREITFKDMAKGTPKVDWTSRKKWGEITRAEDRRLIFVACLSAFNLAAVVSVLAIHSGLSWHVVIVAALVIVVLFPMLPAAIARAVMGVTSSDIAEDIHRQLVDGLKVPRPETYHIPEHLVALFLAKSRLYREAIVMIVLESKAEKNKRYQKLLKAFEAIIIAGRVGDVAITKHEDIWAAMKKVGELLPGGTEKPKIMSWSHDWFKSIGHEENNLVTLGQFALSWDQIIINLHDAIEEIGRLL